jgi:hypothetical protein
MHPIHHSITDVVRLEKDLLKSWVPMSNYLADVDDANLESNESFNQSIN